jgi:hypothetical protein
MARGAPLMAPVVMLSSVWQAASRRQANAAAKCAREKRRQRWALNNGMNAYPVPQRSFCRELERAASF